MLNLLMPWPNSIWDASAQITTDINTEALHHGDAMMDAVQIVSTPRPTNLWKPANVDEEKGSEDTNEPIGIFTTNSEVAHPDDHNKNSSKNGREAATDGEDVDLTALLHGGSFNESEGDKGGEKMGSTATTVAADQHGTHYQPTVFQKRLLLKTYFYLSFCQLLLPPGEAFPRFHHLFWSQRTAFLYTWDNAIRIKCHIKCKIWNARKTWIAGGVV
jgi:hypothetical protein